MSAAVDRLLRLLTPLKSPVGGAYTENPPSSWETFNLSPRGKRLV